MGKIDPEYLRLLEGSLPIARDDPRRAKDFVKCTDPDCWMHKEARDHARRFPGAPKAGPHCHPTF